MTTKETNEGGLYWHRQFPPGEAYLEPEHPKNPSISNSLDQPYEGWILAGPNPQPIGAQDSDVKRYSGW